MGSEIGMDTAMVAGVSGITGAIATWAARNRKVDRVDAVVAIAEAFERANADARANFLLVTTQMQSTITEQSKRIDTLEELMRTKDQVAAERDRALTERDQTIRRLRDHTEVQAQALGAAGIPVPPQPHIPFALDRRHPSASDVAHAVQAGTERREEPFPP